MEKTEIETNSKQFDLGAILNITTGRLFTDVDDIYDILNYLMEDSFGTLRLISASEIAKNYILSIYPELKGVGLEVVINSSEDAKAYIDEQKKIYGENLPLMPMGKTNSQSYTNPVEEVDEVKPQRRM